MVIPIPPAALKTLVGAFGKEALGNPKTAESMAKGMGALGNAVSNGLGKSIDTIKDLALSMDVTAPAMGMLSATFQSQTMQAQTELMIALMELSQSEGVKLTSEALAGIVNSVLNGATNFTKFATDLSKTIGKIVQTSPYFKRVQDAFEGLSKQSTQTMKTALSSLTNVIQTLADNPLVIKAVDTMFLNLEKSLQKVTIALNLVDYILKAIEAKLEKLMPWLFPPETTVQEQGYTITQPTDANAPPSTTEQMAQDIMDIQIYY